MNPVLFSDDAVNSSSLIKLIGAAIMVVPYEIYSQKNPTGNYTGGI